MMKSSSISKVIFYSLMISFVSFMAGSKFKLSKVDAASSNKCSGFANQNIYAVPTASNKTFCPDTESKVIYVSTSGNDNNDGLSPNSPVKSLPHAVKLTRRQSPDWIVLKRGDTFNDSFGTLKYRQGEQPLGGKHDRPLVITSYGKSQKRPVIRPKDSGLQLFGPFGNITISGLEFRSKPGTGGTGIRTLGEGTNYVIHNNYISGFQIAINVQGDADKNKWFSKVIIKDNILVDSASSGKGHSQAVFASAVKQLAIEGNVIDTCGWYKDRNGNLENSRTATIFNHCLYLQGEGYPATVKNNIITRASSHGLQARSGAFVENNLFARNPIQFFLSSKGVGGNANQQRMLARNNIVLEGNDLNDELPRGVGIEHNNAYSSLFDNNIVAHLLSKTKSNNKAISLVCRTDNIHTSITGQCKSVFKNNLIFNWGNKLNGDSIFAQNFNSNLAINHSFLANKFVAVADGIVFVNFRKENMENKYIFSKNLYVSKDLNNKKLFKLSNPHNLAFSNWEQNVEPSAKGGQNLGFVDSCRTMATYYDDRFAGDLEDNCKIMHSNKLFRQFIELAKQKNSLIPGSGVNINSFNKYIRDGFAKP